MITSSHEILDAALALSVKDRAHIAHQLLKSLDDVETERSHEEIDRAWVEEIERRRDAVRDGTMKLLNWDDVVAEIREELHHHSPFITRAFSV